MSSKLLRLTRLITPTRPANPILTTATHFPRSYTSTATRATMANPGNPKVDSSFISLITAAEKRITKQDDPMAGGPTAMAQKHIGQELTSQVLHDITEGEKKVSGLSAPVKDGPTSIAQSILTQVDGAPEVSNDLGAGQQNDKPSGVLDSETLSHITAKEKEITGQDDPVKGGPTAKAQQHAGEPINSQALHDITEGEKKVTDGERIKGGPTSQAQSELAKSRQ